MDAAVNKEKREKRETSSSLLHMTTPSPQAPRQEKEEEEATPEKATQPDEPTAADEAAALVAELPGLAATAGRPLTRALRADEAARLTALVADALTRGWTADRLRPVLTADLASARNPVATWHARLANLGNPPADEPTLAAPASPPKCDDCNPYRYLEDSEGLPLGPCPTCHPSLVGLAASSRPTGRPIPGYQPS